MYEALHVRRKRDRFSKDVRALLDVVLGGLSAQRIGTLVCQLAVGFGLRASYCGSTRSQAGKLKLEKGGYCCSISLKTIFHIPSSFVFFDLDEDVFTKMLSKANLIKGFWQRICSH